MTKTNKIHGKVAAQAVYVLNTTKMNKIQDKVYRVLVPVPN